VAEELCRRLEAQPSLRLCLPTGDTPSPVYGRLVGLLAAGRASLADATLILLDEYVGLPADAARCDARLRRELLDLVSPAPRSFHAIRVDELPPEQAAAEHDAVAAEGLDLVLLGLGGNGHVGLNEPGSTAGSPTRVVELTPDSRRSAVDRYGAASEPRAGITLGMDRLLAAQEAWLLVTGATKRAILQQALHGPETPDVPASLMRRHGRLRVMADESAAGRASRL
jgi:glucosamine-6-phosphate deaminase